MVTLTYHEVPETYCCQAPDPGASVSWHVTVVVKTEDGQAVVDEILHRAEETDDSSWRLSSSFEGCSGPTWVGYRKKTP